MKSMATWVLLLGFWGAIIFGGLDTSNIFLHVIAFVLLLVGFWNVHYYEKDNPFYEVVGKFVFNPSKIEKVMADVSKNSALFVL